ncbi:hypothetical protein ABZU32_37330 [Sphaerisporangium sp. NPDC005288]|uniref:trypsin-like serine peptidase n=1 Tax=Sphaerisporangium sp. NPDC005288 TaxID=3155114 RepID=UPI0033A3A571
MYEDYDSDYAFVTVYNGINYAGEKEVTKSTFDSWKGDKYAKDEKITKEEYDKLVEKYGPNGPTWTKVSDSVESVAVPTNPAPTAQNLPKYISEGINGVKLTGVEVVKSTYDKAPKGFDNGTQFPEISDKVAISQEEYKTLLAQKADGKFLGELTVTKDANGTETAWFKQSFFVKKWVKTSTATEYYVTHYFIIYYKDAGRLGDNVGGQGFTWNQKVGQPVYVFGYPAAPHPDGDKPFTGVTPKWCYGKTFAAKPAAAFKAEAQIGLKCSMTAGSSGAPWLLKYSSTKRLGYINGVTSLIGDADTNGRIDFSTSPYFDTETYSIYKSAANLWSGSIVTKDGGLVSKA